ncbi:MAG: LON peptidase substrate-binding domain-containing protein [Alphaproteobacteria bacterium]
MGAALVHATLPSSLPIFPLPGVLLLPRGRLPLNIFEPRYLAMTEDALKADRLIGMIQPEDPEASLAPNPGRPQPAVYRVGCAGRMTEFRETDDERYLITLTGVGRFRIAAELALDARGYRRVKADWSSFAGDLAEPAQRPGRFDRKPLLAALRTFFDRRGLSANWGAVESASDDALVTALAMACPFEPREKQALLECAGLTERAQVLLGLLTIGAAGPALADAKPQ